MEKPVCHSQRRAHPVVAESVHLKYRLNYGITDFQNLQFVCVGRVQVKSYAGGCLGAEEDGQVEDLPNQIVVDLVDAVPEVVGRGGFCAGQRDGECLWVEDSGGRIVGGGSG